MTATMMRRRARALAATLVVVLVVLVVAPTTIGTAASRPMPRPTATPPATATAMPMPTAIPTATPIPSPTPTSTPVIGNGTVGPGGGDTGCPDGSIHVITIFGQPVCLDSGGLLSALNTAIVGLIQAKSADLFAAAGSAVLHALAGTEDMTDGGRWGELLAIQSAGVAMERDAFAVALGLSILWIVWPLVFGDIKEGVALFWRAVFAEAAVNALTPLLHIAALLANGVGERLVGPNLGLDALRAALGSAPNPFTLGVGGLLLVIAGIERSIAIYAQEFLFAVAPLMLLCLVFPPTRRHATQWIAAYANLLLLGPAFGLMIHLFLIGVVAMGGGMIQALGGFFAIDLVPALLGTLTVVEIRAIGHAFTERATGAAQSAAVGAL